MKKATPEHTVLTWWKPNLKRKIVRVVREKKICRESYESEIKIFSDRGPSVAHLVGRPTLGFVSGYDFKIMSLSPMSGSAPSSKSAWDSFPLPLPFPLTLPMHMLSLKYINLKIFSDKWKLEAFIANRLNTVKNAKGYSLGWRKMIPEGNSDP